MSEPTTPTDVGSNKALLIHDPDRLSETLKLLSSEPGVYRMLAENGEVLYVGKAKNLKKRVSSYFRREHDSIKTEVLVNQIADIHLTLTHSESEALVLEYNLIQEFQPRFNILLRDDKSYPYVFLSGETYPRLAIHRGPRKEKGRYFGPFPSAGAVRQSLLLLQKLFRVRQCENSYFANRTRPCLQYQIGRCTAPCVGYVTPEEYDRDVRLTAMFYEGRNQDVISELAKQMEQAATDLQFEKAAQLRDQIAQLRRVLDRQRVSADSGDVDVVAGVIEKGLACVYVLYVRDGRVSGSHCVMPALPDGANIDDLIDAFLNQFYLAERDIPREIIHNAHAFDDESLTALLEQRAGRKIRIANSVRGDRAAWLQMAVKNAQNSIASRFAQQAEGQKRGEQMRELFGLDVVPQRFECFDISHTMGEQTVASCVVFDLNGPRKSDYRRFNIEGITGGDDYAAMYQALSRRYARLKRGEGQLPDVLFIDGGPGQLAQAEKILDELQIDNVLAVGISKGPDRRAGQEELHLSGSAAPLQLPPDASLLHFIQHIRDEAHRFAITGHRARRDKKRSRSPLEGIDGVGPQRRRELLRRFGGLQELMKAGVDDIAAVPGISRTLAERIHAALHPG